MTQDSRKGSTVPEALDAFNAELVAALGAPGLLALGVWLILTGRLVPRRTYEDAIHDRDEWRAESRIRDQELSEKNVQLAHLAEVGKTQVAILYALKQGPPPRAVGYPDDESPAGG
jgi:hypothetical protein